MLSSRHGMTAHEPDPVAGGTEQGHLDAGHIGDQRPGVEAGEGLEIGVEWAGENDQVGSVYGVGHGACDVRGVPLGGQFQGHVARGPSRPIPIPALGGRAQPMHR